MDSLKGFREDGQIVELPCSIHANAIAALIKDHQVLKTKIDELVCAYNAILPLVDQMIESIRAIDDVHLQTQQGFEDIKILIQMLETQVEAGRQ